MRTTVYVSLLLSMLALDARAAIKGSGLIGYGSSTAIITPKIQEGFLMGFELGLKEMIGREKAADVLRVRQITGSSQLGAEKSATELLNQNVSALFGFPGSHDSLVVGRVAKETGVLTIVAGSNHNDLREMGPNFYTTGFSMDYEVESMLSFAQKLYRGKKGLVIINPSAVASMSQEAIFKRVIAEKRFTGIDVRVTRLNRDLLLDKEDLEQLRSGAISFICLTPYPEALVGWVDEITAAGVDLPIIAGTAWGTVDSDVLRRFIANRKAPFYMAASYLRGSPTAKSFEEAFFRSYAKEPTPETSFGYDLGVIAGTLVRRSKGQVDRESMIAAFHQSKCYEGLSIGKLCFGPKGGHATRPLHYLKYTRKGFVPAS
ncbi:MAG: ABC transporter substrate-binding protein [Deltaproteobacteria bacterium]|nr:ABC transporter substrate-binding protein [Deltaproteobacteria bacterium]